MTFPDLPGVLEGRRVLVADDREADREFYRLLLSRAGAKVVAIGEAEPVLTMVCSGIRFDGVVLDFLLPGARGTEAAASLRACGFDGALIGITAHATPELADLWRAAGCDDVLPKGERTVTAIVMALAEACDRRRPR